MKTHCSVLSGAEIARKELESIRHEIARIHAEGARLVFATVQVGDSKDAAIYSKSLAKLFEGLSVSYRPLVLPHSISTAELCEAIRRLSQDDAVTGIMVFSPLPKGVDPARVVNAIDVSKDAEGRRVIHGIGDRVVPPTARAVLMLVEASGYDVVGKEAVIVGHSDVVGKPTALLLMDKMATVTVCHVKTQDLEGHVRRADIVVSAAGKAGLIKGEWIKKGSIVIDVGENFVDGKLVGDVEFGSASERAAFISPVPGGVGPVTNVMLAKNLVALHRMRKG